MHQINYININTGKIDVLNHGAYSATGKNYLKAIHKSPYNTYMENLKNDYLLFARTNKAGILMDFLKHVGEFSLPVLSTGCSNHHDHYRLIWKHLYKNEKSNKLTLLPQLPYIGYKKRAYCIVLPDKDYMNLIKKQQIPDKLLVEKPKTTQVILLEYSFNAYTVLLKNHREEKFYFERLKRYFHYPDDDRFAFVIREEEYIEILDLNNRIMLEYFFN